MPRLIYICLFPLLFASCLTDETMPNTVRGNFEALWSTLDAHYCFFSEKREAYGLDWDEVHARYAARLQEPETLLDLFELFSEMTYELRDGHVNLTGPHNTSRYGAWFDDYATNFDEALVRQYLGRAEDYYTTCGLSYRYLPDDSVAYVRCPRLDVNFGVGNLFNVVGLLSRAPGLILDLRSNGGGRLTSAQDLAGVFTEKTFVGGYICHKRSAAHDDFSDPEPIEIKPLFANTEPSATAAWTKPVVVLTNRRTYSAANALTMFLKGLPHVRIMGDVTGGGGGVPMNAELPIGWSLRFSACPTTDRDGHSVEGGIAPDFPVALAPEDVARGRDTMIEAARAAIRDGF